MSASPIADLNYRTYSGPLETPNLRWWVIARMTIRMGLRKRMFWLWSLLSAWYYFIFLIFLYITETFTPATQLAKDGLNPILKGIIWKEQIFQAFAFSQIPLLFLTLLWGAGLIANDNRANALLVYLSKPCTKVDYLFGKWMGLVILLGGIIAAPMFILYGYLLLSYSDYGVFTQDRLLILKLLLVPIVAGVFHSSLILGISSLFNQGRVAGAVYAGVFFITTFCNKIVQLLYFQTGRTDLLKNLFYLSVDGVILGMTKVIMGTQGNAFFSASNLPTVGIPSPAFIVPVYLAICGGSLWLAWTRVRAVEVVN